MNKNITMLAEESINIELNVSKIYFLFHKLFPEDSDFWFKLALEEENHADIIRNGLELFEPIRAFPHEILSRNLQKLKDMNEDIRFLLTEFKINHPSRTEAFKTALNLENSAGELHFQHFQEKKHLSSVDEIFQELSDEDKDHAKRILAYMKENDICVD